jgi:NAD-dependent deacetylase
MVWEWYQSRRSVVLEASPNPGHRAIAELESLGYEVSVVTQNIDGLHAVAGSSEVIELHGNIRRNFCQTCKRRYDDESFLTATDVQTCDCGGTIRPDVVWFGEMLPTDAFELAEQRARDADVLFSVGTSSVVWPAAGIPLVALESGTYVVEVNPDPTPLTRQAHESVRAESGTALPELIRRITAARDRERPSGSHD